jgi:aryl-alcohol dehydrogenase-like predicted oxidoreductase
LAAVGNLGVVRLARRQSDASRPWFGFSELEAIRLVALLRLGELVDRLQAIAGRLGCSLAELSVAWTLAVPGVAGAIVGARSPDQVDGWIGASDLELSEEVQTEIEGAIAATGAGSDAPPTVRARS